MYIYAYLPRAILLGVVSFGGVGFGPKTTFVDDAVLGLRVSSGVMLLRSA